MTKKIKQINFSPKYSVGEIVYAISFHYDSDTNHDKEKDEWSSNYVRIYKVVVVSISIDKNGVGYWLKDPKTKDEWGNDVHEEYISTNYDDLVEYLFKLWKL